MNPTKHLLAVFALGAAPVETLVEVPGRVGVLKGSWPTHDRNTRIRESFDKSILGV